MRSKFIVSFRRQHESSPPACLLVSTAFDRALRGRHERCHTHLFGRRFGSQLESFSRFDCLRSHVRISSLREVAYATA